MNKASDVRKAWARVTTWLELNDPAVFAGLGGPGSQEALDRAELRMGLELPLQVRQWLLANDVDATERAERQECRVRRGCQVPVLGGHLLLGLEDIQRVYLSKMDMERRMPSQDPDHPIWRREWLPVVAECDALYGTFLNTADGTIGTWGEADMPQEGVYASLAAFFHRTADLLEGVSTGDWSGPAERARRAPREALRPDAEAVRRWAQGQPQTEQSPEPAGRRSYNEGFPSWESF
ncbi:SMI1/KNR4 family protein [Kitasatospora sp. NA04385]|uniref:SMI1/KNR4 family protein n=1 Tax=Kitasatospora sp. NA04385 TaxID=2742135 RepID=UPI0015920159|nr:SMI1/KNR4 family protein [Kitasatospora sp. NA04385]QKW23861.1 SMI1/KNR4 family protein [Kitasatospora sp. NA04385]